MSFVPCVIQFILYQGLPRAALVKGAHHLEFPGSMLPGFISQVLDLAASNQPLAGIHFQCEALAGCLSPFCHPEVGHAIGRRLPAIYFAQDENVACNGDPVVGSARNHLRFQRTPTR